MMEFWKKLLVTFALACAVLTAIAVGVGLLSSPQETPEEFFPERVQLPVEPTTDFPVKTVREAKDALNPAELVLGVSVGNESRAYPINLLNEEHLRYKILNDILGGQPIAATWCNACYNGIVYDRVVDGQTLTLAVEGQLWKESMVMYDVGTHSKWSHLEGEAKLGRLQGKRLRQVPSFLTDWESWCKHHPEGTVVLLPYRGKVYRRDFYQKPERFVLGVASGRKAKAWGLDRLSQSPVVNDQWDGRPVLAVLDRPSFTARLYERELSGRVLTFEMTDGRLTDQETGSTWESVTGRAVGGPLAGQHLTALPATVSHRDAWLRFYAHSE